MTEEITLINKRTDKVKTITIGWSWSIFLLSPFFSIPLFAKHLYVSGMLLLLIWSANISILLLAMDNFGDRIMMTITCICITCIAFMYQCFLALNGNEMSIQYYLDMGWVIYKDK